MTRSTALIAFLFLPASSLGQTLPADDSQQAWLRTPKQIPFQNDSQWEDNRWQAADVGPFVTASIESSAGITLKGIAIRVGDHQQAAVCFDTARLRISAAWQGEFVQFGPRRFGLVERPRVGGKLVFATPKIAGWANDGRFVPEPDEITLTSVEQGYVAPGSSVVHLPKDWAHYRGLYLSGKRVVLSYTVADAEVLESPWHVQSGDHGAFIRSLEIGPTSRTLQMWVADQESEVRVIGDDSIQLTKQDDGTPILVIGPHQEIVRIKLLIARRGMTDDVLRALREEAGDPENLSQLVAGDTGRWPEVLRTQGTTTETESAYVIDTLTLPFENPYRSLLFSSGHDFFSDGAAALCTIHGDVWVVTGIDRHLKELRWRRYATGLFQPLGLRIVGDKVYVIGRDQITRLHDRNGDGEADFYENFNNDLFISPRGHDFVTCLDTDPAGNFYFIHAKTGVMRVSADGTSLTRVADGFRNPNGMAVGPNGVITASPQQGQWTPESSLIVVRQDGYYGYGGPRISSDRPAGWDSPMCFIPRSMDNSGGAQVWVEGDRWGPLGGRLLQLSYGQCRILLALTENVRGVYQGGTIKLPTAPADFESGIMRGRFNPHDGQLYVSGLRGWQSRAIRDGCFQRLRYTGRPLHLPIRVKTYENGIKLTFTESLDPDFAQNPDKYFAQQWNYRWSKEYGSPDYSVKNPAQLGRDEVVVESATLMDDGHAVFLEMPGRQPVMQLSITWLLRSAAGVRFRGQYAHTINVEPSESIVEAEIVRRQRVRRIDAELERRLEPGVLLRFKSIGTGEVDTRVARLVALHQPMDEAATPFLPAGPFSLEFTGTISTPLSGYYDFKIDGSGSARLSVNREQIVDSSRRPETAESIVLHKGHNRIRLHYTSPDEGTARLRLLWKGHDFDWEPVPPTVFFHDSGDAELREAQQRRDGRRLFAEHRCAACHRVESSQSTMFELTLAAPDLARAGDRLDAEWLQEWLVSPRSLRPSAHMPAVLGSGNAAARDAADITAYLMSRRGPTSPPSAGDVEVEAQEQFPDGGSLFESLGCISCHHFETPQTDDRFDRRSLHDADAKYRKGALAKFLQAPAAHHVASRMPDFSLSGAEAAALAAYVRSRTKRGRDDADRAPEGDASRGEALFGQRGCRQCHTAGDQLVLKPAQLDWGRAAARRSCLAAVPSTESGVPHFAFTEEQRRALEAFLKRDLASLQQSNPVETSARLVEALRCANCHDRDQRRSQRDAVVAEEGSGQLPEPVPALTWSGELFQPTWTEMLLAGGLRHKPRPWLAARMPAFPAYAQALAHGLSVEHGIDQAEQTSSSFTPELATIGEQLSRQTGLDCRQCHAIGKQQPRGDKDTQLSEGINFSYIRRRLRREPYQRLMLNPQRFDVNSKMIRLSEDGRSTKLRNYFSGSAHQQFDALWHYMQSLPPESD